MVKEYEIIKRQLGREPNNLEGVVCYCPLGKPAVLKTLPYRDNHVFPTLYWLSCPYLVREVSRLEEAGLIKELTTRLQTDQTFRMEMETAHQNYAKERLALLTPADIEKIKKKSPGILTVLQKAGVGGIREKEGIKCLHTHLAAFLANRDNPVGELVWKLVDWPRECEECQD